MNRNGANVEEAAAIDQTLAIDARQLGELVGLSLRTIRRLDCSAKLPRPVRIGGAVRWRFDEIKAWLAAGCPDRQRWENIRDARRVGQR